jgi:hypothetical protein
VCAAAGRRRRGSLLGVALRPFLEDLVVDLLRVIAQGAVQLPGASEIHAGWRIGREAAGSSTGAEAGAQERARKESLPWASGIHCDTSGWVRSARDAAGV